MMHKKVIATACVTALSMLAVGLSAVPANGFSDHDPITSFGLSDGTDSSGFVNLGVRVHINEQHDYMDAGFWDWSNNGTQDEYHFDDCEFDGSINLINWRYADATNALKRNDLFAATAQFGRLLHTVQDFYSHSNWVEMGFPKADDPHTAVVEGIAQSDLVDMSGAQDLLGRSWFAPTAGQTVREDILLANDDFDIPDGWRIAPEGAGRHQSQLVRPNGTIAGRLLETGKGFNDSECSVYSDGFPPIYFGFSHDELHKDNAYRGNDYLRAKALAFLQTGYEWCRLVAKAGQVGSAGMLLSMAVRPGAAPHPPNTPCKKRTRVGPLGHPVTVTIESVQILDAHDSGYLPGEIQLSAALYGGTQDFHRSVRLDNRSGKRMLLNPGDFVPRNELPEPLTMCVPFASSVNFALYGWDNDDEAWDRYGQVYDNVGDDNDEMLVGGSVQFSSEFLGVQTATWDDLTVRYRVTRQPSGRPPMTCDTSIF